MMHNGNISMFWFMSRHQPALERLHTLCWNNWGITTEKCPPSSSVDSKANHCAIGTASYLTIVTENTQQAEDGLWVQAILALLQSYMQQENYKFRLQHIMLL